MKRFLAILLCLAMCVTLMPAAFAGEIEIIGTDDEDLITLVEPVVTPGDERWASKPTITVQPASKTAYIGTVAEFTVKARNASSYQWYWRKNADSSWGKTTLSGAKTATLTVEAASTRNGYQYCCRVSNEAGSVYTKSVTLTISKKPVITDQPASKTTGLNQTVNFTVKADGATAYRWYYRKNDDASWARSTLSGAKTATLSVKATEARNGFQYKCRVSNEVGHVYTSPVSLTIVPKPCITLQPISYVASVGATIYLSVEAENAESYQWQYRAAGSSEWKSCGLTGNKTACLTIKGSMARDGYRYRCKVTNAAGSVNSASAKLTVYPEGCGEKANWSLSADGLLTIGGSGAMTDYEWDAVKPWEDCIVTVTSVVIDSGVTHIGDCAFIGRSNIESITIGDGVTSIGECALFDCDSLTDLVFPEGLTVIGESAFEQCDLLSSVTIPASVTEIGQSAFADCAALTSIKAASANTKYASSGGVLFNKGKTVLLQFPAGKSGAYTVPSTVNTLGDYCFSGAAGLTELTLPAKLRTICDNAFYECEGLTELTVPASVTAIKPYAFDCCPNLSAILVAEGSENFSSKNGVLFNKDKSVLLRCPEGKSGAYTVPSTVKTIANSAFASCVGLSAVTIPSSVTDVEKYAFFGCSLLTGLSFPNSVTDIGDYVFCDCSALKKITFGTGLRHIGEGSVSDCESLTDVYYRGTKTQWDLILIGPDNDSLEAATMHYNA